MKKFILESLVFFLIIASAFAIGEILLPQKMVTFRNWEAFSPARGDLFLGRFYPNYEVTRNEVGELAHHSPYAVKKKNIYWKTDEFGYRNNDFIQAADILLVGASNVTGSGVSQENTLTNKLIDLTGHSIYNISPIYNFKEVVEHLNERRIEKPKVLIYAMLERGIPDFEVIPLNKIPNSPLVNLSELAKQQAYLPYLDRAHKKSLKQYVNARFNNSVGAGIQSPVNDQMFFIQGENAINKLKIEYINHYIEAIKSYQAYCNLNGIQFAFIPIPNKETMYYEMVPFEEQPSFISILSQKLIESGIHTVDFLGVLNDHKDGPMLFPYDDTHLNAYSLDLMAKTIAPLADELLAKADSNEVALGQDF